MSNQENGKGKVNEFQVYLSEDYRLNAEGQMVQNTAPRPCTPAIDRFKAKIHVSNQNGLRNAPCWNWIGSTTSSGYGEFKADGRRGAKKTNPHRFAYQHYIGSIPEGYEVDHLCKNRLCCNPAHLEAITLQENRRRRNADQTHCKQGHEFNDENTLRSGNRRRCRICSAERSRKFMERHPGYNAQKCQEYQARIKAT